MSNLINQKTPCISVFTILYVIKKLGPLPSDSTSLASWMDAADFMVTPIMVFWPTIKDHIQKSGMEAVLELLVRIDLHQANLSLTSLDSLLNFMPR